MSEIYCYKSFLQSIRSAQCGDTDSKIRLDVLRENYPRTFNDYVARYKRDLLENKILY